MQDLTPMPLRDGTAGSDFIAGTSLADLEGTGGDGVFRNICKRWYAHGAANDVQHVPERKMA